MSDTERIATALEGLGISKTVYSLVLPETIEVLNRVLDNGSVQSQIMWALQNNKDDIIAALQKDNFNLASRLILEEHIKQRQNYHEDYLSAYTQKQDDIHEGFFKAWFDWTENVVSVDANDFTYQYPCNGSSEAIRAAIFEYATRRKEHFADEKMIHVFDGEYEGYTAFAQAACLPITYHPRFKDPMATALSIADRKGTQQVYLSQPSAIDGNIWDGYNDFMEALNKYAPNAEVMLDLTYVGSVAKDFQIKADYPNIRSVFFSLSKPAGVYYHRVGGILSRENYPALFGNKWFKNLQSLKFGTEFMKTHGVHDLPTQYRALQETVTTEFSEKFNIDASPADVLLLANFEAEQSDNRDIITYLRRSNSDDMLRVCLMPSMEKHIYGRNFEVQPRYYETLKR